MKKRVMKVIQHQTKTIRIKVKFAPVKLGLHEEELPCQISSIFF